MSLARDKIGCRRTMPLTSPGGDPRLQASAEHCPERTGAPEVLPPRTVLHAADPGHSPPFDGRVSGRPSDGTTHLKGDRGVGDPFPCTACGACCRSLADSPLYAGLDRGDGVCRHLDECSNLCRIYDERPPICRVADMYEWFSDRLAWPDFVELNLRACAALRARVYPEGD